MSKGLSQSEKKWFVCNEKKNNIGGVGGRHCRIYWRFENCLTFLLLSGYGKRKTPLIGARFG